MVHGKEVEGMDLIHATVMLARDNTFLPWVSDLMCSKGVSEEQKKNVLVPWHQT